MHGARQHHIARMVLGCLEAPILLQQPAIEPQLEDIVLGQHALDAGRQLSQILATEQDVASLRESSQPQGSGRLPCVELAFLIRFSGLRERRLELRVERLDWVVSS